MVVQMLGTPDRIFDVVADVAVADVTVEVAALHEVRGLPPRSAQQQRPPRGVEHVGEILERAK